MDRVDYRDTFIAVAHDCPATAATAPTRTAGDPSVAARAFEMVSEHPYRYTSGEVIFGVFADAPPEGRSR